MRKPSEIIRDYSGAGIICLALGILLILTFDLPDSIIISLVLIAIWLLIYTGGLSLHNSHVPTSDDWGLHSLAIIVGAGTIISMQDEIAPHMQLIVRFPTTICALLVALSMSMLITTLGLPRISLRYSYLRILAKGALVGAWLGITYMAGMGLSIWSGYISFYTARNASIVLDGVFVFVAFCMALWAIWTSPEIPAFERQTTRLFVPFTMLTMTATMLMLMLIYL